MFGHQDDQQTLNDQAIATAPAPNDQNWTDQPVSTNVAAVNEAPAAIATTAPVATTPTVDKEEVGHDLISNNPTDDLLDIKRRALSELSPIVNHLDQTPEEKFRTTMMMLQASDDQSLVKVAYDSAQQITDEKLKAQALLDIVNEINYFTNQAQSDI